jgi:hypothetical protein
VGAGLVVSAEANCVVTAGGEGEEDRDSKALFERRRDGVVGGQAARIKPLHPNDVSLVFNPDKLCRWKAIKQTYLQERLVSVSRP